MWAPKHLKEIGPRRKANLRHIFLSQLQGCDEGAVVLKASWPRIVEFCRPQECATDLALIDSGPTCARMQPHRRFGPAFQHGDSVLHIHGRRRRCAALNEGKPTWVDS